METAEVELKFNITREVAEQIEARAKAMGIDPDKFVMFALCAGFDSFGIDLMANFQKIESESKILQAKHCFKQAG